MYKQNKKKTNESHVYNTFAEGVICDKGVDTMYLNMITV